MGKSTACLRIIACGGGSIESNEAVPVDQIQTKHSKEKKGWSFKKKASTSRAVTNSVIAETPSLERKENVQSAASESIVSEKDSALQWDEKSPPPPQVAANLFTPDAVKISGTEKQPTTVAAASFVAADVYVPKTGKQATTAAAGSYVADVSVPKAEKQSDPADFRDTDDSSDPKNGDYEAVLAVHESDVVIIQSAVRGFLARKELKSIIKLQAMVRGHLVRCHAVGALRCVQAIAKMQVLVRARYARPRKDGIPPKSKPELTYTSMTDLLRTSFARQLLDSSQKSKPIKIKCDPLSRDSSWVWLERWMSLASPGAVAILNAGNEMVQEVKNIDKECEEKSFDKEQEEKIVVEDYLFNEENELFSDAKDFANPSLNSKYSKLDVTEVKNLSELTLTDTDVDTHSVPLVERQKQDILEKVETVESESEKDSLKHPLNHAVSIYFESETDFVDTKVESKTEHASELEDELTELGNELGKEVKIEEGAEEVQLRTEEENVVSGSQEESANLLVTESELVSAPRSAKLSESAPQDARIEEPISTTHLAVVYQDSIPLKNDVEEGPISVPNSATDYISGSQKVETEKEVVLHRYEFDLNEETTASSDDDIVINHKEASQADLLSIQVGESECSIELSITSTLDSPDRLEVEPSKVELERVVSADVESHEEPETNSGMDALKTESGSVEKGKSDITDGDRKEYATDHNLCMDEKELDTKEANQHLRTEASHENETITNVSDMNAEPEVNTKISHQASPGSQVTFSESQGTPSSQASISTKSQSAKSGSIKKRTILSAAKKTGKSTIEHQPKEQKSAKRRTSFGSPKPEVSDQERRRDSSTSSSLPSYMQATESAKAKANAAGQSPHSSPDVADNVVFLKKRHSLSGTKDKQNSPRLQRTSSQAQSGQKSNGTSPLERKWQR